MGMDLTCYCELRDRKTGEWKIAPVKVETVRYVAEDMDKLYCYTKAIYEYDYAQPWIGRNYELFNVLDGTHSNSIANTRGLPVDLSEEVRAKHEEFKRDDGDGYWCLSGISGVTMLGLSIRRLESASTFVSMCGPSRTSSTFAAIMIPLMFG